MTESKICRVFRCFRRWRQIAKISCATVTLRGIAISPGRNAFALEARCSAVLAGDIEAFLPTRIFMRKPSRRQREYSASALATQCGGLFTEAHRDCQPALGVVPPINATNLAVQNSSCEFLPSGLD